MRIRFSSIQNRLAAVFTLLFLSGAVMLVGLLGTSVAAMSFNARARITYTQARQLYGAQVYLQKFREALVYYELTEDYDTMVVYYSSYASLQQSLATLAAQAELPDEKAALQKVAQDVAAMRQTFDPAIQAVEAENWDQVAALNERAPAVVDPIAAQIAALIETRNQALVDLRAQVLRFSRLAWLAIALAAPLFLAMIAVVVTIVARQIHIPILRMADALDQVRDGRFDPASLAPLPERHDEIGYLAREYVRMAGEVQSRRATLEASADEIRAKIR